MPDIVEPDVTVFVNEVIRPIADHLVGMKMKIDIETIYYANEILPLINNAAGFADGDLIFDGSESDGRIQLTRLDLTTIASAMSAVNASITANADELVKAHSNPNIPGA